MPGFHCICMQFYNSTNTLFGGYGLEYVNGSIRPIQVVLTQYTETELNASDMSFVLNGVLNTSELGSHDSYTDGMLFRCPGAVFVMFFLQWSSMEVVF